MFKNSRVTVGGRLIITAIFALTVFGPEIVILRTLYQLDAGIGMSLVRLLLEFVLYCCAMQGHGWARWFTAFVLIGATAVIISVTGRKTPLLAVGVAVIFVPSIAMLLGLKAVQASDQMRLRRRRTNS